MSEMVERVARAVHTTARASQNVPEPPMSDEMWRIYWGSLAGARGHLGNLARAAIAAMREPTDGMDMAGEIHGIDSDCQMECNAIGVWQAMIDKALE